MWTEESSRSSLLPWVNVWGVRGSARLPTRRSAAAAQSPRVSTSTQPTLTITLAFIIPSR